MKTSVKIAAFFFAVAAMIACASGESEALKQARQIQDNILKSRTALDSTIDATIASVNEQITTISADSAALADSTVRSNFEALQVKVSGLAVYKSQIADWAANMKMLPSVEELAKGTENPFGAEAKDEDILNSLKASEEEFNNLKSTVEAEISK